MFARPPRLSLGLSLGLVAALALSPAVATAQSSLSNSTTITVSPAGSPSQNGSALLSAVNSASPSRTQPLLVKIEPGTYDLGTATLFMKPWMDIEGSGIDITRIEGVGGPSGDFGQEVVSGADNAEIRELTVKALGSATAPEAIAFQNRQTSPTLRNVRLVARGDDCTPRGLRNIEASPTLEFVTIEAIGGVGSFSSYGIVNRNVSRPSLSHTTVSARGATQNFGIFGTDGASPASIRDSSVTASGGTVAVAYEALGGFTARNLFIKGSTIQASAAATENVAIRFEDQTVLVVQESTINGFDSGGTGIDGPSGSVRLQNSSLAGGALRVEALELRAAASWLRGGGAVTGAAVEVCAGVWDGAYVFYPNTCP